MSKEKDIMFQNAKDKAVTREYSIEPVQREDEDDVMKLLMKTFFVDEPLNAAIGLNDVTNPKGCSELYDYCMHSLFEGLSFKAVDEEGEIIAVMISGVCPIKEVQELGGQRGIFQLDEENSLFNQAKRCQNPKFQKILFILARREEDSRLWDIFPEEKFLVEIKVAATDPKWRQRGIMTELLKRTERETKQRDIRVLRLDTSSAYSAQSAKKLGFKCVYRASYKNIKFKGKPLITPEPPHYYDCVFVKKLDE